MSVQKHIFILILAGILLASCAGQGTEVPTVDTNSVETAAVQTFVAALTQTQVALPPTETTSPTITSSPVSLPTLATLPTQTQQGFVQVLPTISYLPTATGTQYTPTTNPSTLAAGCNNLLLISDVTIPAGTVMKPGEKFTKTWKVANTGTCDWVYLYRPVFISGDQMAEEPAALGKVIVPGKWTQISVAMQAPSAPGTYMGYWRLGTQTGTPFGSTLTVSIVVAKPTSTPVPPTTYP